MRILENNFNGKIEKSISKPKKEITICCENCDSTFVMDSDEFENECTIGCYGIKKVVCPCCGEVTDTEEDIKITSSNIQYPTHFYHSDKAVNIIDDDIQKWINNGLKYFKENPNEDYWYTASGNTTVILFNLHDEIEIRVFKDEYSCYISKED